MKDFKLKINEKGKHNITIGDRMIENHLSLKIKCLDGSFYYQNGECESKIIVTFTFSKDDDKRNLDIIEEINLCMQIPFIRVKVISA